MTALEPLIRENETPSQVFAANAPGVQGQSASIADPEAALPPGAVGPISPSEAAQRAAASNGAITLVPPKIVAARMTELASLHGWMPHDMAFGLAQVPVSDAQLLKVANGMRDAYSAVDKTIHLVHNDPVLQKQPSALLTLQRFMNSSIGPWPIADEHLVDIQKGMQKQGFGQGLPTDGVWDTAWNSAYDQWSNHLTTSQLGGNQVGGTTAGHVLNALTSFLPKEAGNAIVGFVKGLGHEGRAALATVAGAITGLAVGGYGLATGQQAGSNYGAGAQAMVGRFFDPSDPMYRNAQTLINGMTYKQALVRGASAGFTASSLGDIGKGMLVLHGAMKAGSDVSVANSLSAATQAAKITGPGREAKVAALGLGDAVRGPGVVANTLGQGLKLGDHLPFMDNVPVLGKIGPWVAKLPDADGLYYRGRTLLATPSAFMPLRVAGTAMGQAGIIGTKLRAEAAGLNYLTGQDNRNIFSHSVEDGRALDGIDTAMRNRLQFTALGHHVQLGLDTLPFLLHIPAGAGLSASSTVGHSVDGAVNALSHALGTTSTVAAQIERGTGQKISDLAKDFDGGLPDFIRFWTHNVYQHAAAHYAETEFSRLPEDDPAKETEQSQLDFHRAKAHEAMSELEETGTPTILNNAISEMLGNSDPGSLSYMMGGPNELSKRIARDIGYSGRAIKKVNRDGNDFLRASDTFENEVLPRKDMLVHGPDGDRVNGQTASLGLARKDTVDARQAALALSGWRQKLEDPNVTIGQTDQIQSELTDFMTRELGLSIRQIPGDIGQALDKADDYVRNNLAGPVRPAADAPDSLHQAIADIDAKGYKLVHGTDIGWRHVPQTPLDVVKGPITRRRKLVEALGLNPDSTPTADVSFWKNLGMRSAIQKLVDDGKISLPAYHTVDSLLAHLWDSKAIDLSPDPITRAIYATVGRAARKTQVEELIPRLISEGRAQNSADAEKLARADLENELVRSLGLENVSRRKVVQALTTPPEDSLPEATRLAMDKATGMDGQRVPFMSEKDANRVYRAIVQGSAAPPGYVLGLSKLDQLARTGYGAMGFLGDAVPGKAGDMLANLPNALLTIRNRLRFQLSPEFSFRRIVKANAKLAMDGVPAVLRPLHAMKQAGTYAEDIATLDRVMPELSDPRFDSINESLYSNDVFGLYSHKNWEAYAAGTWARQGKSDDEIRQLLVKDFGYGSARAGEGRSAAERSMNTVFFPFSFDKTLYRNVGGYLLDHPARMMLLTGALNAYHALNQAHQDGALPGTSSWFDKHMPVAQEALRLNAFAHGISLGQFGGINAPLLNMFLPQKWDTSAHAEKTLASLVPAYTELNGLWGELVNQGAILDQTAKDEIQKYTDPNWHPADWKPAETSQAQQTDAYVLRRQIMASVEPYISYNNLHKTRPVLVPKTKAFGKYGGDVINAALVDRMVHDQYPAYDPNQAVAFSDIQKQKLATYVDSLTGPDADYIRQWVNYATQVGTDIYEGKLDGADAQAYTAAVRHAAVVLGERDGEFLKMYNGQFGFRWEFGPLTVVKQ